MYNENITKIPERSLAMSAYSLHIAYPIVSGSNFRFTHSGKDIFSSAYGNGELTVSFVYSSHPDSPLTVRASAVPGDAADLVVYPHRIELRVNGILLDEEWPWGDCMLSDAHAAEINTEITVLPMPEEMTEPIVTGSFTGGEGWRPGNGVFVGDCMPYTDGERYHVLYLKDRHHHRSKWHKGAHQWAHISTADFLHWDEHPMAVEIDDPTEGSICTGSWICERGRHLLYYTVRMADGSSAPICRSVSQDGYHFEKDRTFRFQLSEAYTGVSARDPKIVRGDDGLLHMFVTSTHRESEKGVLVHLISADGDNWSEAGCIYTSPDRDEPECPDYFRYGDCYYLIFSHHGTAQYRISDKPFTDWRLPENPHIPCEAVPKAAVWNGRILFTGFNRMNGYAGTLTFMEARPGDNGELVFFPPAEAKK